MKSCIPRSDRVYFSPHVEERNRAVITAFGSLMRKARWDKNMKERELAAATNTTRAYIAHIERGARTPSMELAMKIAEVLEIDHGAALRAYAGDRGDAGNWLPSSRLFAMIAGRQVDGAPANGSEPIGAAKADEVAI